jgi:hypothetical protein
MHRSDVVVGLSDREMCSVLQKRVAELEDKNLKLRRKLNAVNTWEDRKYPDTDRDILCQVEKDTCVVGYFGGKPKGYYSLEGQPISVIRWQEIILPEE